jgi:hypothetical protein
MYVTSRRRAPRQRRPRHGCRAVARAPRPRALTRCSVRRSSPGDGQEACIRALMAGTPASPSFRVECQCTGRRVRSQAMTVPRVRSSSPPRVRHQALQPHAAHRYGRICVKCFSRRSRPRVRERSAWSCPHAGHCRYPYMVCVRTMARAVSGVKHSGADRAQSTASSRSAISPVGFRRASWVCAPDLLTTATRSPRPALPVRVVSGDATGSPPEGRGRDRWGGRAPSRR